MTKKEKTEKAKKVEKPMKKPPLTQVDLSETKEDGYGGLPNRDLKKNLGGCG